jgi:glycerate-2-kinase
MAQALEVLWDAPMSGLVVTRYGHIPPRHDAQIVFIPWGHHLASDEIDFR